MRRCLLIMGLVLGVLAAGCGKDEKEKEQAGNACPAAPPALSGKPPLPPGFPTPSSVTYTASKPLGPSRVVKGYYDGEIDTAFDSYKSALGSAAGYSVIKDEHEEVDAEVNFAGHGSSGQVKLVQRCRDRTSVTITARPG
jgi:hypothetical protein